LLLASGNRHFAFFRFFLLLLLLLLLIPGCAAVGSVSVRESDLRQAVLADQSFTVESIPAEASAHRAASLRLAAEAYRSLQEGRPEEAEDGFEKALSLDPRNPFCYLYLAEIRHREGDTRQAIVLLHQGEVMFQGHPYWLGEIYTREGRCWEALDDEGRAQEAYAKALEQNPWSEEARKRIH
jgi:tetratricopeptide (TPR) repeat protein